MNNADTLLYISILLSVILACIIAFGLVIQKSSIKQRYIFSKKIKNINWKYLFKVWLIIQSIVLLSTSQIQENILVIISSPIILIGILLSLFLFNYDPNTDKYIEDESVLKSFERDEKIKKILK